MEIEKDQFFFVEKFDRTFFIGHFDTLLEVYEIEFLFIIATFR